MARPQLSAEVRPEHKKSQLKSLRLAGLIPATVYGHHLGTNIDIKVSLVDLRGCVKTDAGANAIIDLAIEGDGKSKAVPVMIKTIQRNSVSRKVLHVEFQAISMDEKVIASVPVHLQGDAIGVTAEGGVVEQAHRELTIHALPGSIPPSISIDISGLHVGDSVKIGDIQMEGVEIDGPADDPIVVVRTQHAAAEPTEEAVGAEESGEAAGAESAAE